MAINNHSKPINGASDNEKGLELDINPFNKVYELIVDFDAIKTESKKLEYIKRLETCSVDSLQRLGEILRNRLVNPPSPIPDKNIFTIDLVKLDKLELMSTIYDLRFLLAVKYRTF